MTLTSLKIAYALRFMEAFIVDYIETYLWAVACGWLHEGIFGHFPVCRMQVDVRNPNLMLPMHSECQPSVASVAIEKQKNVERDGRRRVGGGRSAYPRHS